MKFFQSLSDSEMEIMRYVWDSGEAVTTSILLEAFAHKGWKVQTVSTFLTRLADKGALRVEKRGKANVYFAAVTEAEYHELEARHLVDSKYRNPKAPAPAGLRSGYNSDRRKAPWPPQRG